MPTPSLCSSRRSRCPAAPRAAAAGSRSKFSVARSMVRSSGSAAMPLRRQPQFLQPSTISRRQSQMSEPTSCSHRIRSVVRSLSIQSTADNGKEWFATDARLPVTSNCCPATTSAIGSSASRANLLRRASDRGISADQIRNSLCRAIRAQDIAWRATTRFVGCAAEAVAESCGQGRNPSGLGAGPSNFWLRGVDCGPGFAMPRRQLVWGPGSLAQAHAVVTNMSRGRMFAKWAEMLAEVVNRRMDRKVKGA